MALSPPSRAYWLYTYIEGGIEAIHTLKRGLKASPLRNAGQKEKIPFSATSLRRRSIRGLAENLMHGYSRRRTIIGSVRIPFIPAPEWLGR